MQIPSESQLSPNQPQRNWQADSEMHTKTQGSKLAKTILKNKVGGLALHDFKTCHAAVCTRQESLAWPKHRHVLDGTELSPEISAHNYGQLILDKSARQINGEGTVFSANWTTGESHARIKCASSPPHTQKLTQNGSKTSTSELNL